MTAIGTALLLAALSGATALPATQLGTQAPTRTAPKVETTTVRQESEINKANWEQDSRIIAIREIVSATNGALKSGALKTEERRFRSCADIEATFLLRRIAHDAKGGVPWYANYLEGQDSSLDFQYYYDGTAKLRFVYAMARSANGTREQLRIYFDEAGKQIWKTDELLKGSGCPGCFSGYEKSGKGLVSEPAKAFADDTGCKEIKPEPKPSKK